MAYKGVIPPVDIVRYAKVNPYYAGRIIQWGRSVWRSAVRHRQIEARKGYALTALVFDGTPLPEEPLPAEVSAAERERLRENIWVNETDRLAAQAEREKGVRIVTPARQGDGGVR